MVRKASLVSCKVKFLTDTREKRTLSYTFYLSQILLILNFSSLSIPHLIRATKEKKQPAFMYVFSPILDSILQDVTCWSLSTV